MEYSSQLPHITQNLFALGSEREKESDKEREKEREIYSVVINARYADFRLKMGPQLAAQGEAEKAADYNL